MDHGHLLDARAPHRDRRRHRQAGRLGGSRGRREATGRGLLFVVNEAVKSFNMKPENTRVVVQGSGNVGGIGAQLDARGGL